ncbi:unnamed protein product, partial [Choristocarpus tenellus]
MEDKYGAGAKGLNTSGGGNRFKYRGKRSRAKDIDVDVSHKVRADGYLDADAAQEPEFEGGSFFQQELDRAKELNVTSPFKRFYYKVWPLVQSLPELLHHGKTVVDMLLQLLEDPNVTSQVGEQVLQLLSVLARDLQGSFFPFFPRVSEALVALVSDEDVSPEICGQVLRCLGFLLKFLSRPLARDMGALKALYPPLLGHRKDFARRLSAQSLATTLRRLKPKGMRRHVRALVGALAAGASATTDGAPGTDRLRKDTLDGCSQLLFFTAKGVQGRTHSQAPVLLRVLLESLLPKSKSQDVEGGENLADGEDFEHRKPERMTEEERVKQAWCFELVRAVLSLLVNHVRSPHSTDLWMELHLSLGVAVGRHKAALLLPPEVCSASQTSGVKEGGGCAQREVEESASLRHVLGIMSQAVGHMGGILLREEAVAVKQSALLSEALAEMTDPKVFWDIRTSPECRAGVVDLMAASLCALHRHPRMRGAIPKVICNTAAEPLGLSGENGGVRLRFEKLEAGRALGRGEGGKHPALLLSRALLGGRGSERTGNKPPPLLVIRTVALPSLLEACAGPLAARKEVVVEVLVRVMHGTGVALVLDDSDVDSSWDERGWGREGFRESTALGRGKEKQEGSEDA